MYTCEPQATQVHVNCSVYMFQYNSLILYVHTCIGNVTVDTHGVRVVALSAVTAFLDYVVVALAVATVLSFWCCGSDDED